MRMNTPVTNVEYELREGFSIVSRTDPKGLITYVNPDFIEASGFTEKELIGQPHNLVRHPDMPEEAFKDLWDTLKKGRPWTGIVKNRRKNGDHYWVIANVTPIYEGGSVVGYMSVRSKPTRQMIEAHDAAYRLFKEGRQGKLTIKEGRAVKAGGISGLTNAVDKLGEKARMLVVFCLFVLALLVNGVLGYQSTQKITDDMQDIAIRRMALNRDIQELQYLLADNRTQIMLGLQHNPDDKVSKLHDHPLTKHTDAIESDGEKIQEVMKRLDANAKSEKGRALLAEVVRTREAYWKDGIAPAREALLAGNYDAAETLLLTKINPLREENRKAIEASSRHEIEGAQQAFEKAHDAANNAQYIQALVTVVSLLLSGSIGLLLLRYLTNSLRMAREQLNRIAQGHYHDKIDVKRPDQVGMLMYAMKAMQIRMGFEVTDAHRLANEAQRVKVALDNVGTGVMIADKKGDIIYLNKSVEKLLAAAETDLRKALPNFSVASIIGSNMDVFHKNPAQQQQLLTNLRGTYGTEITVSGHTFALSACPVVNEQGERLGSAIEWRDRTAEVAVEKEVAEIVNGAANGDFTRRIRMEGKDGFFMQLGEGMNRLMDTSSAGLDEVARVLGALAKGDLTEKINNEYQGTFGQLKDDSNSTVDQLTEVIKSIKEATDTINTAAREIASGNTDLSQRTEEQASSLEETAASMEQLTSTVKQNAENAKQANQLAAGASDIAMKGGEVVGQVVQTMSSISESSKKISDIISVIDGIAFQTNILALNAAVEAARAGEQGRGFAVVASEVRNLAQRSAAAAKDIKALISDSVDKVAVGTKLADKAGKTMEEVVTSVKRVTDIMAEISAASVEQSSGIEQVNQAISQMDDVTQQNAALVEQAAAAAESLEEQAQQLSDLISTFRLASGDRQTRSLPVSAWKTGDVNSFSFEDAVNAHVKWKTRLVNYIKGTSNEHLEVAQVSCDDKCDLGRWLYGPAMVHSRLPEYRDLRSSHADFHRSVGEIVQCVHDNHADEALNKLGGKFYQYSNKTVRAIRALQAKVEGGGASTGVVPRSPARAVPMPGKMDDDEWKEF